MSKHRLFYTLFALIAVVASAAPAQVSSFAPPEPIVSGRLVLSVDKLRPGDEFQIAFEGKVREGYHIGANDKNSLYPARLTVKVPAGITLGEPVYPKAALIPMKIAPGGRLPVYDGRFVVTANGRVSKGARQGRVAFEATFSSQGCKDDACFPPEKTSVKLLANVVATGEAVTSANDGAFATGSADQLGDMGMLRRLLWLYLGGVLLAFTPCVYPMIPVTVGYFSNQSEARSRKRVMLLAACYVLGIALTYSLLGALAATTGGVFGAAMQKPPVQIGVALVLVALALSMFGLYELRAPGFIQSRASGRSGALGALVMGLVFGLVAAPCVGPVVLSLMAYVASTGSAVVGFSLFFALALGIGTPLFALAVFSAKLPAPGVWMVVVKKLAGFLLIGAAAYFVRPIVPEGIGRLMIPGVILAAGVYLGLIDRSLAGVRFAGVIGKVFLVATAVLAVALALPHTPKASLTWQDYSPEAVVAAAEAGRPVMIDFTAAWCGACQELEHGALSDPKVIEAAEGFVRLRVDNTNSDDPDARGARMAYRVEGFPTIVFLRPSGLEAKTARVVGVVDSKELLERIEAVR